MLTLTHMHIARSCRPYFTLMSLLTHIGYTTSANLGAAVSLPLQICVVDMLTSLTVRASQV